MADNYWSKVLSQRLNRRRALAIAASSGAAAAILACGGDDSSGGAPGPSAVEFKDTSGLLSKVPVTTDRAKPGGIWQHYLGADYQGMDPMRPVSGVLTHAVHTYSQLVKNKTGTADNPPNGALQGDMAESWEISNDGLQITLKIRPNMKTDPGAPVNGRVMDAQDVVYSWDHFVETSLSAQELSSKHDPNAPFNSWTAVDKNTVVIKMNYGYVPALDMVGDWRYTFVIVPVEYDTKFDPKVEWHGSGPFTLTKYTPSSRAEYRKNPNYWDAPRPYLDGIDYSLVPEYAQQLAQFHAGNLWEVQALRQEDILPAKKQNPKLNVWVSPSFRTATPTGGLSQIAFSRKEGSPFNDIRVRRGLSMLIDRSSMFDVFGNLTNFRKEGIDLPYRQSTIVTAADDRFWVDPTGSEIGPGGKWHQYNPQEATALLNAAGIKGLDVPYTTSAGTSANPQTQAIVGFLNATGHFNFKFNIQSTTDNAINVHRGRGLKYDGIAQFGSGSTADPELQMTRFYDTSAFSILPGKAPFDDLLQQQRKEFDFNKRQALWKQIQQKWADEVTDTVGPFPGIAITLNANQPWFGNFGGVIPYVRTAAYEAWKYYWYDASQKT